MVAFSRVVIYDEKLYQPGHMVWRWVGGLTREFARHARNSAPVRTGRLRRGIRAGTPRGAAKTVRGTIGSTAEHTSYVLHGTHGPIMSNAAWGAGGPKYETRYTHRGKPYPVAMPGMLMAVGRNPWPPVTPMEAVGGQWSNNFFYPAWVKTAARHPALRGVPFPAVLH